MIRQVSIWEELSLSTNQEIHRNRATRNLESKKEIHRSFMYFRNIVTMGIYTSVYILHLNGIICSFASVLIYEYFVDSTTQPPSYWVLPISNNCRDPGCPWTSSVIPGDCPECTLREVATVFSSIRSKHEVTSYELKSHLQLEKMSLNNRKSKNTFMSHIVVFAVTWCHLLCWRFWTWR
jgi:hypothetical protein